MIERGYVLDAGPFLAIERSDRLMRGYTKNFADRRTPLVTSAGVVAQVWRGGAHRQVPLAFLLRRTEVIDLTDTHARVVGTILGLSGTRDPIDAHVALLARQRGWPVITSDVDDLRAIDPSLELYPI